MSFKQLHSRLKYTHPGFSCCGAARLVYTVLLAYREETKQPRRLIASLPLLEFSPALESWSDIYTCPTSCLVVPQMFSSVILSAISIFRSLGSAVHWTLSPPYHEQTCPWYSALGFLKRFWKIAYPAFKGTNTKTAHFGSLTSYTKKISDGYFELK